MASLRLSMGFKRADGGNSSISVDDARSDITEAEVNELMDTIISSDIFAPNDSPLTEKVKAELISTEVVEFNIV